MWILVLLIVMALAVAALSLFIDGSAATGRPFRSYRHSHADAVDVRRRALSSAAARRGRQRHGFGYAPVLVHRNHAGQCR